MLLLLSAAAIWPGSPLFETWYQGRNLAGGPEVCFGVILLAAGVGGALTAVRSRSRTARALGFAFGSIFAGFTAYWFTRMALRVYNVDGVEMHPMTVVLISFTAHPFGWGVWYFLARTLGYHKNKFPEAISSKVTTSDNRYCWPILNTSLGGVSVAGVLGFLLNINHYETFSAPSGSWTPVGMAYLNAMRFETILLIALPAVMWCCALIGTREKLWVPGRCRNCDYDLRGSPGASGLVTPCPECGDSIN
ncbi:MAG: hypothetical protein AAF333_17725 [Planctomycetota bacterium]